MPERNKDELVKASCDLLELMRSRRSVRDFSSEQIPVEVIKNCIALAGTAPSGANMQPWSFVLVKDGATKKRIREASENIEAEFYTSKIKREWQEALQPLGTDRNKPFLEEAPYLICIFLKQYEFGKDGTLRKMYYPHESVGIATGFLLSALHTLGISTLTYTPAPMTFLRRILNRPENERPYMIVVAGYGKAGIQRERQEKKTIGEILTEI